MPMILTSSDQGSLLPTPVVESGRLCPSCREVKPPESFTSQMDYCRRCHARHKRVRYQARKLYDVMMRSQGGVCAACGREPRAGERFHVDHDHKTDRVRDLLCYGCNSAYGLLHEDESIIRGLLAYHSRWSEQST